MKPTLEQLQEFTDLEINIAVTEKLKITHKVHDGQVFQAVKHDGVNVVSVMATVDYCNNWSDMGALANKHKINAIYSLTTKKWTAFFVDDDGDNSCNSFDFTHTNELRAKAIVFLLMDI